MKQLQLPEDNSNGGLQKLQEHFPVNKDAVFISHAMFFFITMPLFVLLFPIEDPGWLYEFLYNLGVYRVGAVISLCVAVIDWRLRRFDSLPFFHALMVFSGHLLGAKHPWFALLGILTMLLLFELCGTLKPHLQDRQNRHRRFFRLPPREKIKLD